MLVRVLKARSYEKKKLQEKEHSLNKQEVLFEETGNLKILIQKQILSMN